VTTTFPSGRLEAFSDGVFAIAITLLVLDLRVPLREPHRSLASALAKEWPSYGAYLVSFAIIGIIWVNHHTVFRNVRAVDRPVLFANLFLLGVVSLLPFPTRLLAEYLRDGWNGNVAAMVYSAAMLAMSVGFSVLWLLVTRERADLLHEHIDRAQARGALRRFGAGLFIYLATIAVAALSAGIALIVHAVLAVYYSFDQLAGATPTATPGQASAPHTKGHA
jgi:uncharacterized membrane protein